jgi:hypothetical protein
MTFELLPIMDIMFDLYQKPRTLDRFEEYLKTLQGDTKGDLILPIGGFNPMAKDHALEKLSELKELHAEQIIKDMLVKLNRELSEKKTQSVFKVVLNLSDDLKGGGQIASPLITIVNSKLMLLLNGTFVSPSFGQVKIIIQKK